MSTPAPSLIVARYQAVKAAQRVRELRAELHKAEDALGVAHEDEAVAMVAENEVPEGFRLATSEMLWAGLRAKQEISTGGAATYAKAPGPGFMSVTIGLLVHWIPCRHYWEWSEAVRIERETRKTKEAGK